MGSTHTVRQISNLPKPQYADRWTFEGGNIEDQTFAQARHDAVLIGEHFSAWRRLRGLRLIDLAERSGISVNTIRDLEGGKGGTGIVAVLAIARALEIDGLRPEALDPFNAEIGRALDPAQVPQRVR